MLLLVGAACGDTPTQSSSTGSIEVTASTSGEDVDPDGYTLTVDGSESLSVDVNETVASEDVSPGQYVLELTGVASNCSVEGQNPRTVQVSGGGTATTTFEVSCSARTGQADVTTSTSGGDPDSDGYTVTVDPDTDGASSQSIGTDETVTFEGLEEGEHAFELTGLANNCSVDGENPVTASVSFDEAATVTFEVTCSSRTGDLEVSASTSGQDPDSDGYEVVVDGTQSQSVGPDGSVTFEGVAEGDHEVELEGVANNCSVDTQNPVTVTVPFEGTATVTFDVSCTDAVGDLAVSAATSGQDPDSDGYEVVVDGTQSQSVGPDGSVTFEGLAAGTRSVELTGVAANCSVDGQNPRPVDVPNGGTASTDFEVSCSEALGDLQVTTSTSGEDQDSDGYTVTVSPDRNTDIGPNESRTFSNLDAGDHEVELTGIASNCSVDGASSRTVTVPADGTTSTTFDVTCDDVPGDLTVETSTTGEDLDPDGYEVTVDPASPNPQSQSIGVNGTVTFADVTSDDHTVELDESTVANNCSVDTQNPVTETVPRGGSATVSFELTCTDAVGDLDVSASTSGEDQDTDGYEVVVDGTQSQSIGPDGSTTFTDLAAGTRSVELTGLAPNCSVDGQNPRDVDVPNGGSTSESFSVSCVNAEGDLTVETSTGGEDQDTDGYDVVVDGTQSQSIGPNGSTTFADLDAGDHQVELTGRTDNCSVDGQNPRTVSVPNGGSTSTSFSVTCTDVPGDLDVTASTTGSDLDSDGYTVTVDPGSGGPSQMVPTNGTITFNDLTSDDHTVELDETTVADNCSVDTQNPVTVTVPPGGLETASFDLSCDDVAGDLEVTASTTGSDLDSDGYTVTVDPGSGGPSQTVPTNGTITFNDLTSEQHTVELDASTVADNCSVDTQNPVTVTVPPGGLETASFDLSCDDVAGDLEVTASTTGSDLDSDGYTVIVDPGTAGEQTQTIDSANGSTTFIDLTSEQHEVELDETTVADNCSVDTQNPVMVTVPPDGLETASFDLSCDDVAGDLEVITTASTAETDSDGYTVTVDGSLSQSMAVEDTVTFTDLTSDDHQVELTGLDTGCSVDSSNNPRTVTVPPGDTESTTFSVSCSTSSTTLTTTALRVHSGSIRISEEVLVE